MLHVSNRMIMKSNDQRVQAQRWIVRVLSCSGHAVRAGSSLSTERPPTDHQYTLVESSRRLISFFQFAFLFASSRREYRIPIASRARKAKEPRKRSIGPLHSEVLCSGGPPQATLPEKAPSSLRTMCQEHRMWNQEGGSSVPALYE